MRPKSRLSFLLLFLLFHSIQMVTAQDVVINEIMSDNDLTIEDEFGENPDWIEIYNRGSETVNLGSYFMSDDMAELQEWKIPDFGLDPGGFLLIFASDRDTLFHANFKISSGGEKLYLSHETDGLIHSVDSVELKGDQSFGRDMDGSDVWKVFHHPSPGFSNNSSNALYFSHERGFHTQPFYLKIHSEREMPVYYTLDGSEPSESSNLLSDSIYMDTRDNDPNVISTILTTQPPPVNVITDWEPPVGLVKKATVIKCRSFKDGVATSPVYSATFFVDPQGADRYTLPVFSFITDSMNLFDYDSGIYVPGVFADSTNNRTGNFFERGIEWEKPVHIEYFEKDGEAVIVQDGGLRIHGQYSRRAPQKSLRLYARNEYGKKLFTHPLLPKKDVDEYKRIVLRSSITTFDSRFGDAFIADNLRNLDFEIQDYQPVVVFMNGEYWGVHNMRDYIDKHYINSLYPEVHEDSINMLRFNGQIMEGSSDNYWQLINFVRNNKLSVPENFNQVRQWIDYSNYLDYVITEIYMANRDWPGNNHTYWQPQIPGSKWRWILNDLDASFRFPDLDMFSQATDSTSTRWPNPEWSTLLFRSMANNEQFKADFICRAMELLKDEFNPTTITDRIPGYKQLFVPEMEEHMLRWNYPSSKDAWVNYYDSTMVRFANTRPVYFLDHMTAAFGITQTEIGELCDCCDLSAAMEVDFQRPVQEEVYDFPAEVEVEASRFGGSDQVVMSLFLNGQFISTLSDAPYRWDPSEYDTLMAMPEGAYDLKLMAFDTETLTSSIARSSFTVVELSPGSLIELGNPLDSIGANDVWTSNMVINKSDSYTNLTDTLMYMRVGDFNFYAQAQADPVTPFIVRINGEDDFTVLAVGETRSNESYAPGENIFPFIETQDTTLVLSAGETIATGFVDAFADGTGGGLGAVIPYNEVPTADHIWYSGSPNQYKSGWITEGHAPYFHAPPRTYYQRNYLYSIGLTIADSLHSGPSSAPFRQELDFTLYPNPVNGDYVNIRVKQPVGQTRVTLYDLQGRTIFTKEYHQELIQISSDVLTRDGTYVVKVESANGVAYRKLIRL